MKFYIHYKRIIPLLFLLTVLGCRSNQNLPIAMPIATVPPNVNPHDVYINQDTIEAIHSVGKQHPGGFSPVIFASYGERFQNAYSSYHTNTKEPFTGQLWVWNADTSAHTFAILCLMNYVQIPCSPIKSDVDILKLSANQEDFLPIELHSLTNGMHDFEALVVRDPYVGIETANSADRVETRGLPASANIYAGSVTNPPVIDSINPDRKAGIIWDKTFFISPLAEPHEDNGSVMVWLDETININETLEFYIHFGGDDDPENHILAVTAYINYKQVPLIVDEHERLPLYVQRQAKTWQHLKVGIRSPNELGIYELLIVVRTYPHTPFEVDSEYISKATTDFSQRIRLVVTE